MPGELAGPQRAQARARRHVARMVVTFVIGEYDEYVVWGIYVVVVVFPHLGDLNPKQINSAQVGAMINKSRLFFDKQGGQDLLSII